MRSKPDFKILLTCPKCKQEIDHLIGMEIYIPDNITLIETYIIKEYDEDKDEKDPKHPMSDGYDARVEEETFEDEDQEPPEYKVLIDKIKKLLSGYRCPKCRKRININMDQLQDFVKYKIDYCNVQDYGKPVVNLIENYTPKKRWLD